LHRLLFAPLDLTPAGPGMTTSVAVLCGVAVVLMALSVWLTARVRGRNP
jgi:hypothetical protein